MPPMQQHQHLVLVRGVQEAVAGGQAVQLETLLAGVARIRKHRAVGTCDGYLGSALICSKKEYCKKGKESIGVRENISSSR